MAENNATCKICGKPYYVCMSCADSMKAHPWKVFTDSSEHYKVFQAVRGFSTGMYTEDEFESKLQNIDLSDLDDYRENIKTIIENVLKKEKVNIEEIAVEEVVTDEVIMKPTVSRKRNYKVETE